VQSEVFGMVCVQVVDLVLRGKERGREGKREAERESEREREEKNAKWRTEKRTAYGHYSFRNR
tara:strand:- start:159 stop:347 length:189 start_codon:yes stop_codon:yes gene_type:complete